MFDDDYDKYIRFYLDSMFEPQQETKKSLVSPSDVYRQISKYIKNASKTEDFLFSSPLAASWNLTQACNFRCVHCLYSDGKYSSQEDLSIEQALRFAGELIDAGVISVELTGGEVFLRQDTMDIVQKFKENNISVRILTNGSLLTDKNINRIAKLFNRYTDAIQISLDAATAETFRRIRHSDKFYKINENIQKLTDKGVFVENMCTLNIINKDEIVDIYRLSKNLGASIFRVAKIENFNNSHYGLNIANKELFKIYYELSQNELFDNDSLPHFWGIDELLNIPEVLKILEEPHYQEFIKKYYNESLLTFDCQCHDKIAIQSDGRIYLCTKALNYDLAPLGNYKDNSFAEIWERRWDNPLFQPRNREKSECAACKYNTWCGGGCKVDAYLESKNVNMPAIPNCRGCN